MWIQRANDEDGRKHLRRGFEVGQLPAVARCPYILAPTDLIEAESATYSVSTKADTTLDQAHRNGSLKVGEISALERNVREALGVLHSLHLVHHDMRLDNIFCVNGVWKLGDFGAVLDEGEEFWLQDVVCGVNRSVAAEGVQDDRRFEQLLNEIRPPEDRHV